jgi:predicted DNA-binding transcriptional regulator AlpA
MDQMKSEERSTAIAPFEADTAGDDPIIAELREIKQLLARSVDQAELLSCEQAAIFCGMSRAKWDRLRSQSAVPAPVRVGGGEGMMRWSRSALLQWIADGCPSCE